MPLLIYTHEITSRVQYTFNLFFRDILDIEFEITDNRQQFESYTGARINYSNEKFGEEISFKSSDLLFETEIRNFDWSDDNFANAFFLATRYEEYLPFNGDEHGRYASTLSIAHKKGFLQKPVINIWAEEIKNKIFDKYPSFHFPQKKYNFISSIDVDNAYAYLEKEKLRTLGGYVRAILKNNKAEIRERKKVFSRQTKDPYDTFDILDDMQKKYNLETIYFFLLADYARNDKNVPYTSKKLQSLIKTVSEKSDVGIHASFASNSVPEKVMIEKNRLEIILSNKVFKNRQHFLILKFPETYRNLIDSGIKEDYSMGYADQIGFRAGICTPYKFYDLLHERETELTIHPFPVMDATLNLYMKLKPEDAVEKIKPIIDEIKKVNGNFILLWHNESLSEKYHWQGWKNVYEEIVKAAL